MREEILREEEFIKYEADISHIFYIPIYKLYALSFLLLYISNELHIGVVGIILLIRTIISNFDFINEKRAYACTVTNERLITFKGHNLQEINPVSIKNIKTIFVKPVSNPIIRILKLDIGSVEVLTNFDGRYIIENVVKPYEFHKSIIGDVLETKSLDNNKQKKEDNLFNFFIKKFK